MNVWNRFIRSQVQSHRPKTRQRMIEHLERRDQPAAAIDTIAWLPELTSEGEAGNTGSTPAIVSGSVSSTGEPLIDLLSSAQSAAKLDAQATKVKPTPGFMLVGLGKWSQSSVDNLLEVVTDAKAPSKIDFSFATRIRDYDLRKGLFGTEGNATALISGLAKAGKSATVTIYMGFHRGERGNNTGSLQKQTGSFIDFLSQKVKVNDADVEIRKLPNIQFILSPSLEDEYSTVAEFQSDVRKIAQELTRDDLASVQAFSRSSTNSTRLRDTTALGVKQSDSEQMKQWLSKPIKREFHGLIKNGKDFEVYSNDGQFVYSPHDLNSSGKIDEDEDSGENAVELKKDPFEGQKLTIDKLLARVESNFKADESNPKTMLFWRPAYNLFPVLKGSGVEYKYDMDRSGSKNTFESRTDSDNSKDGRRLPAHFNVLEQQLARKVLGTYDDAAPVQLRARHKLASSSVNLSWLRDEKKSLTAQRVEIGTIADGKITWDQSRAIELAAADKSTEIAGLDPTKDYAFRVVGVKGRDQTYATNTVRITKSALTLAFAWQVTATDISARSAKIGWGTLDSGQTGFRVEMSLDGSTWNTVGTVGPTAVGYSVAGLLPSTSYKFKVQVQYEEDYVDYSGVLNVRTLAEAPGAPGNLRTSSVTAQSIDLNWDDRSNNETEFRIAISRDGGSTWNNIGTVAANTSSFRVNNLQPNTRYMFKVRASNGVGFSDYSNVLDATTRDVTPIAPTNLRATNIFSRAVDLTWDDRSNNESEFRIAVSRDEGATWDNIAVVGTNVTSFRANNLEPNSRYLFKLRAANSEGYSDYSNNITLTTRLEPPVTPDNLRAANVFARSIDLNWDDRSNNESEFRIAISRDDGATWDNVGVVGTNVTGFRANNLEPNTRYLFKVRAANSEGYSEYSNTITLTTRLEPPVAPGNLRAANVFARTIDLNWDDRSNNASEFRIAISRDGGATWDNVGVVGGNASSFRVNNMLPNTRYMFKVRAVNIEGFSDYSNILSVTTARK